MYNSNLICLPLWLIAISKGPLPLYWVWGKCCENLIEQLCVVSPWGGPLYWLLPRWLTVHVSSLPFSLSPSSFILWLRLALLPDSFLCKTTKSPVNAARTFFQTSLINKKAWQTFGTWKQKLNLFRLESFWAAIIKWSESIVVSQDDKQRKKCKRSLCFIMLSALLAKPVIRKLWLFK